MWKAALQITHDCIFGERCRTFQVEISVISFNPYERKGSIFIHHLGTVNGKNSSDALRDIGKDHRVVHIETEKHTFFIVEKRAKKETPGGHHHHEIIYTKPVLVRRDGIERWELAALRKEVLMEFVKGLKQSGTTVSIASIKQAPLTDIYFPALSPDFSEQQQNALSLAKKEGYYDFPRKAWLAQLANVSGVSISTFREHLRKAERKLLSTAH